MIISVPCPYCDFEISGEPYKLNGLHIHCPHCQKKPRVSSTPSGWRASRSGPKRKYTRVLIVISEEQWKDVKARAYMQNISASEYIRNALTSYIGGFLSFTSATINGN